MRRVLAAVAGCAVLTGCWGDLDADAFPADEDCDDTTDQVHPRALEIGFDGLDNDCDPTTVDACEPEHPCVDGVCAFDVALQRVRVGGVITWNGEVLPPSDEPVGVVTLVEAGGHEVIVPVRGGGSWSARVPEGLWTATFTLTAPSVQPASECPFYLFSGLQVQAPVDLESDLAPRRVTGRASWRDVPLGPQDLVSLGGCDTAPDELGRYELIVPPGTAALSVFLSQAQERVELGDLHVADDVVRDITLRAVTLSGQVSIAGAPDGWPAFVLVDGRPTPVDSGVYSIDLTPGSHDLAVRVQAPAGHPSAQIATTVASSVVLKKDQRHDFHEELFPVEVLGELALHADGADILFRSPRGSVRGRIGSDSREILAFRDQYRVLAGTDLDRGAEVAVQPFYVREPRLLRLDREPVALSGALTLDGEPLIAQGEARVRFVERRRGEAWSPVVWVDDGRYETEVVRGVYDIFVDGFGLSSFNGLGVAARGRLLTGGTARSDLALESVWVDVGLSFDARGVQGELVLTPLDTTRSVDQPARVSNESARSAIVPVEQGRAQAQLIAGGLYAATLVYTDGDMVGRMPVDACWFLGDEPPR